VPSVVNLGLVDQLSRPSLVDAGREFRVVVLLRGEAKLSYVVSALHLLVIDRAALRTGRRCRNSCRWAVSIAAHGGSDGRRGQLGPEPFDRLSQVGVLGPELANCRVS
jgi:hypothetical protein